MIGEAETTTSTRQRTYMKKTCIHFVCRREPVGFSAKAVGLPIFTQGDTFEELEQNIKEVLELHFEDEADA